MGVPADFTEACSFPYLHGAILAINAIPDAYLLVDAPSCNFFRAEQVFGFHDLNSTLIDVSSRHRAMVTDAHIDRLIEGRSDDFSRLLVRLVEAPFVRAVFHASSPVTSVIGTPYEEIVEQVAPAPGKPLMGLPHRSLQGDWLDGFEDVLTCLARAIPLEPGATDPRKVAIVGYRMDRNEEDHRANLREMARLLAALGLDLVTVWPGGEEVASMARVAQAGTLVAFPAGRKAAALLSERTGARVLDGGIPFGPTATDHWIREIGQAFGEEARARDLVEHEARQWAPSLKWLIPKRFLDSRWVFVGDPDLMPGFCQIADLVGAEVVDLVAWSAREIPASLAKSLPVAVRGNLASGELARLVQGFRNRADLVVGNTSFLDVLRGNAKAFEFGFPCLQRHALFDSPFLGYRGFLWLAQQMAERMRDALSPR